MCETCKAEFMAILNARIRKILAVAEKEPAQGDRDAAQAHCFHLMEIRNKLNGEDTCGVFD